MLRRAFSTSASPSPIDTLKWRGLLHQITRPSLDSHLASKPTAVYAGFDPTAQSLHVGNLLTIVALIHFAARGHQPIALIGGATASIGDPSGRSSERNVLPRKQIIHNSRLIRIQLENIFRNSISTMKRHDHPLIRWNESSASSNSGTLVSALERVKVLDNYDWFHQFSLLDFMGSVGRFARVSQMLAKDSVKSRLDAPDGISFTEFTYQLLQGYDFQYLNKHHGVSVQIGGSDQWGNITAGIDLIRKMRSANSVASEEEDDDVSFGLTFPLVTTASGEKFGKSAGNAIWMDKDMVSPFDFYQFFRRTPDSEVERYLKFFTFMSKESIELLMEKHEKNPHLHLPQRTLAYEVTHLVHGSEFAKKSQVKSELLYDSDKISSPLSSKDILDAFEGDNRLVTLAQDQVFGGSICQVATIAGVTKSISAARKLIASGGLYLNNTKVTSEATIVLKDEHSIDGSIVLLRSGKSKYTIVSVS
ncbi:tyrosine-tRNA ligase [Obelidium mucronatum]|nr:tyrosine-tRNA ligase [Obelidium mucronatum]